MASATTDSNHALNIAPNLLDQDFSADGANQKWAGDISYIWTSEGWLYLAVILNLYSGRVIGCAVSNRLKQDLAIRALDMALDHCPRTNGGQGLAFATAPGGMHSSYRSWIAI
jgi:transposase InsO family protein